MKRKDIQKAITEAKSNDAKVREKVVIFENVLSFIFDISDRERCDYYDAVLLYICYGIVPNFAALSPTKAQQFRLLFSLLKKQRIGWENSCKSDTSENLPHNPTNNPTPDQVYKDKKIRSIEDKKIEEDSKKRESSLSKKSPQNYTDDFEQVWQLYGRKGSKPNAFKRWLELTDEEKERAKRHIPSYIKSNDKQFLKDMEGYLHQKAFDGVVIDHKTGSEMFDPSRTTAGEYNPDNSLHSDVGFGWDFGYVCKNEHRDPYKDMIFDGYTNDTRPDGALLYFKNGLRYHRWDAQAKVWRKVEGHWDREKRMFIEEGQQ